MATPPKPVTDNVITAAWGGAVHDAVFSTVRTSLQVVTNASGVVTVTATQFAPGIATIQGWVTDAWSNDAARWTRMTAYPSGANYQLYVEHNTGTGWAGLPSWGIRAHIVAWGIPA